MMRVDRLARNPPVQPARGVCTARRRIEHETNAEVGSAERSMDHRGGAFDPAKFPIDSTLQQCVGLDIVIRTLVRLPAHIVRARLWELSEDSSFSYKMRAKFKVAAERL